MKVRDTNGYWHNWNLVGHIPKNNNDRPRSDLHLKSRQILKQEYPTDVILEEVMLPGEHLYCDFFLPRRSIVVEVMGEQHYKYIPFFHNTPSNFVKARKNDERKRLWCEINNITIVEFIYTEDESVWLTKLRQ